MPTLTVGIVKQMIVPIWGDLGPPQKTDFMSYKFSKIINSSLECSDEDHAWDFACLIVKKNAMVD